MSLFDRRRYYVDRAGRRYVEENGRRYYEEAPVRPWALIQGAAVGVLGLITGLVLGLGFLSFVLAVVLGVVVFAVRRR